LFFFPISSQRLLTFVSHFRCDFSAAQAATIDFQLVNYAYDILKDPLKRARVDKEVCLVPGPFFSFSIFHPLPLSFRVMTKYKRCWMKKAKPVLLSI
jgi:hypothetical protein